MQTNTPGHQTMKPSGVSLYDFILNFLDKEAQIRINTVRFRYFQRTCLLQIMLQRNLRAGLAYSSAVKMSFDNARSMALRQIEGKSHK